MPNRDDPGSEPGRHHLTLDPMDAQFALELDCEWGFPGLVIDVLGVLDQAGGLASGRAVVDLDSDFDAVVKGDDYRVLLTEVGDCGGLYVAREGPHRFAVRSRAGVAASGAFDYRVVARRKADLPKPIPAKPERLLRPVTPPAPPAPPNSPMRPAARTRGDRPGPARRYQPQKSKSAPGQMVRGAQDDVEAGASRPTKERSVLLVAVLTIQRPVRQHITHTGVSSAHRDVLLGVGTVRQVAQPARPDRSRGQAATRSWRSHSSRPWPLIGRAWVSW
jgi:hypothetical protein